MNEAFPMSVEQPVIAENDTHVATVGGIPIKNLWFMLLYAWDRPELLGSWRADVETAPNLATLLARILARLVQQAGLKTLRLPSGLLLSWRCNCKPARRLCRPGIAGRIFGNGMRPKWSLGWLKEPQ